MNKRGFLKLSLIILSVILLLFIIFKIQKVSSNPTNSMGPNYETTCNEGICISTVYSYQKYYQENEIWIQIDENFNTQNCEIGYDYCVDRNLYQFNAKNDFSDFEVNYGNTNLLFSLNSLGNLPMSNSVAEVENNVLTYRNVVQGIDVRYIYLPHKIKEEIAINSPEGIGGLTQDVNIRFNLNSSNSMLPNEDSIQIGDLFIRNLYAYDSEWNTIKLNLSLNSNILTLTVPFDWLTSQERVYPVYIDPTFETNLSVSEDIYIENKLPNPPLGLQNVFTRYDSPVLKIGYEDKGSIERIYRADLDWNIPTIPENATITALNMTLTVNTFGDSFNYNISATQMENNSSYYPDNSPGNEAMWNDMGNGTNYTIIYYTSGTNHYFNLMNASSDFNFSSGHFNLGLYSIRDSDSASYPGVTTNTRIYWSSEATNSSHRPSFVVTYTLAENETEGDNAIVQGINNSLPNNPIQSTQQIYLVNETGGHYLGTFDKTTIKNNQTWAFSYVTSGESFINMPSLFNILNVWENSTLSFDEIVSQVEMFINNTIIN